MFELEYAHDDQHPTTMPCPLCGQRMRLNYTTWKEPRYVCDSYRTDSDTDCGMIIILKDYRSWAERSANAS